MYTKINQCPPHSGLVGVPCWHWYCYSPKHVTLFVQILVLLVQSKSVTSDQLLQRSVWSRYAQWSDEDVNSSPMAIFINLIQSWKLTCFGSTCRLKSDIIMMSQYLKYLRVMYRALCRIKLLPVTHVLVDTWMLTVMLVYELWSMPDDLKWATNTHMTPFILTFKA